MGFAPKAALLPGIPDIAALLNVTEVTTYSKTISSPRIITQNRNSATITQGQQILLATAGGVGTAGGFQSVNATLSLSVEPQVTNEGGINLRISFAETSPGAAVSGSQLTTNTKSVETMVLVDSGATVVIGGVYTSTDTVAESGIPFLRDIPILGAFFGGKSKSTSKNELFIFLTPRILNEKEAGLRSS
jgi:type IV pilus assembly protein PilQ